MWIQSETAFLVCLCLWIPVAQSQNPANNVPEDEETSGDNDLSGSGSGSHELLDYEISTQASVSTTKTAWVTDDSVRLWDQTTTLLPSMFVPSAQTSNPITKTSERNTTTMSQTPPSPTSGKTEVTVKDVFGSETATAHHEETTLPQQPVTTEPWVTTSPTDNIEETTAKLVTQVKMSTVSSGNAYWSTSATEVEATSWTLTTTGANEPTDSQASGDSTETATTVPATTENIYIKENMIPVVSVMDEGLKSDQNDFDFEVPETRPKTKSLQPQSESALGSSSENESLLEKKEVLAGVVAGGVVGLAFAVMLVALMVYRMKKKDEGSYALDEHKHPNGGYCKPQRQEEFLA